MTTLPLVPYVPVGVDPDALALATAAVRDFCGWHIAPSITETVTVRANQGRDLLLPTLHLTAVTDVVRDGVGVVVTEWDEVGTVRFPDYRGWSGLFRGNVITFTHGYDECPAALAGALLSMASRGVTSLGVSRTQVGQVSRSYLGGATDGALGGTDAEMAIIRRYRIPPLL